MAVEKIQKKITGSPRKVGAKKAKSKKAGLAAIDEFVKRAKKYNLDFNYINE